MMRSDSRCCYRFLAWEIFSVQVNIIPMVFDKRGQSALPQPDSIDVWTISWRTADANWQFLSPAEQDRARRFHFERDRNRFAGCRSWLRIVLGGYLGLDPADVRFEYGERGKPSLATDQNGERLQFNLAHSGDFGLLGVAVERRVGLDIEQIDRFRDHLQIAERYFSRREADDLEELPAELRREGFVACWTRKEAFIKALGLGLSLPLSDFSVTVHPHAVATINELPPSQQNVNWWLQDLSVPDGYRAALVTEGGTCVVRNRSAA